MELKRKFLETADAAPINWAQVGRRREAILYAIEGIKKHHDAVLRHLGQNPLNAAMEGSMKSWVIETLYQGAYLREYHLWEKDCKAYFQAMAVRNDTTELPPKARPGQPFTEFVRALLGQFSVVLPQEIFDPIERMRSQVNIMKHDVGC